MANEEISDDDEDEGGLFRVQGPLKSWFDELDREVEVHFVQSCSNVQI